MMIKKETFWTDAPIAAKLNEIPEGEKAVIIRMALRQYFGITGSKPMEPTADKPLTLEEAKQVARLMRQHAR